MLLKNNPYCYIVTGRPRTPRDQGSVESANKLVSQIRKNISCERRRAGLEDNWTKFLGQIMACCNSNAGRARQSISNYESVFGLRYHTGLRCSLDEMRQCRNISERLRISPDDRLQKLVAEMDIIDGINDEMLAQNIADGDEDEDPEIVDDITDEDLMLYNAQFDDGGATTVKQTPHHEELVSETNFDQQLDEDDDDLSAVSGYEIVQEEDANLVVGDDMYRPEMKLSPADIAPPPDTTKISKPVSKQQNTETCSLSGDSESDTERTTFKSSPIFYTVQTAFLCGVATKHRPLSGNRRQVFNFVYPKLTCECCHTGHQMLEVGDDDYNDSIQNSTRWWDQEFVTSFTSMAAHYAHTWEGRDSTIILPKLIHIITAKSQVDMSVCRPMDDKVEKIVGIIHKSSHYAVMEVDIKRRIARIYDGLGIAPLLTWLDHIINALQMCQLVSLNAVRDTLADKAQRSQHPRTRNEAPKVNGYTLTLDQTEWRLERGAFVSQTDGYNCGPIACLKILELYSLTSEQDVKVSYSINSIRKLAIEKWRRFLDYCNSDLIVRKRFDVQIEEPRPMPGITLSASAISAPDYQQPAAAAAGSSHVATAELDVCICCVDDLSMELVQMKCCRKTIHKICLVAWLAVSNRCVHCRGEVNITQVLDYPIICRTAPTAVDSPYVPVKNLFHNTSPSPTKKRIGYVGAKRTIDDEMKAAVAEETPLRSTDKHREDSMKKKRAYQKMQSEKWIRQRGDSVTSLGVSPGAVLVVKVDSRDVSHATGIPGIAWKIGNGGGVRIATAYGILSNGNRKGTLYLAYDKWQLHCRADEMAALEPELQQIRDLILRGEYDEQKQKKCSIQECHQQLINSISPNRRSKCNCKGGQCKAHLCGCILKGFKCTSACACNGNCTANPNNGK